MPICILLHYFHIYYDNLLFYLTEPLLNNERFKNEVLVIICEKKATLRSKTLIYLYFLH